MKSKREATTFGQELLGTLLQLRCASSKESYFHRVVFSKRPHVVHITKGLLILVGVIAASISYGLSGRRH